MILLPKDFWEVRNTKEKGQGVFAKKDIESRKIIAQYTGYIIPIVDIDLKVYGDYLMSYDENQAIVPNLEKTGAHLLNHSCNPNCWLFPYEKNIFFINIRDIKESEELTIHYLYHPLEDGCENCTHICMCGSKNCTGTMHTEKKLYDWWQEYI